MARGVERDAEGGDGGMICESCVRGDCVCCLIDAPILDRFGKKWKALCECDNHEGHEGHGPTGGKA